MNAPAVIAANPSDRLSGWVEDRQDRTFTTAVVVMVLCMSVISIPVLTVGTLAISFKLKWMPLLAASAFIIFRRWTLVRVMVPEINLGLILITGWIFLSAAWSPNPVFTVTQAVSITELTMAGLALAVGGWYARRFELLMVYTLSVLSLLSLLWIAAFPDHAIHHAEAFELSGSWRGITVQKNTLGQLAAMSLIASMYVLLSRQLRWPLAMACVLLALFVLIGSRSNTSLILSSLACILMTLILRPALNIGWIGQRLLYGSVLVLVPAFIYLTVRSSAFGFLSMALGKGGSFTGRTPIWQAMMDEIAKHPMMGIGFSSFWQGAEEISAEAIEKIGWTTPNGHNGYVDLTNELGLIGLVLLIMFLVIHVRALGRLAAIDRYRFALHSGIMLYVVTANISETCWFFLMSPVHLLMMMSSLEVSRILFSHRLQQSLK